MKKKKIFSLTTSRSDYGLLRQLYLELKKSKYFNFTVLASGMHLNKNYGLSIREVEKDNFKLKIIKQKNVKSDKNSILKSISNDISNYSKLLIEERPDFFIVLGDRFEILGAVISCYFNNIPIIHLHGGEKTEGSYDDITRHVVTKYSTYHLVSHLQYKKRVIQLGENPNNVFVTGPLAIDSIKNTKFRTKTYLEKCYNFKFRAKNILVTYHPITNDPIQTKKEIISLISFLKKQKEIFIIFTFPNLDLFSNSVIDKINKFVKNNTNSIIIKSFGQKNYFSTLRYVDCVIGNSSSGVIEVPFFKIPTINIGNRQEGRLKSISIIDSNYDQKSIENSFKKAYSKTFLNKIKLNQNLYTNNKVSKNMLNVLKKISKKKNHSKLFFDLKFKL